MIRVTLDTNEIISAFNFGGKAIELFHRAADGELEIAISEPIVAETIRVLRDKFDWNPYRLHALRGALLGACKLIEPKSTLAVVADEPDNRIIECAAESESKYIITEDRALLRIKKYAKAELLTAVQFFEIVSNSR